MTAASFGLDYWSKFTGTVVAVIIICGTLYKWPVRPAVRRLMGELADKIGDAIDARVPDMIERAIAPVRAEVTANGGGSLKDKVKGIAVDVAELKAMTGSNHALLTVAKAERVVIAANLEKAERPEPGGTP